MPGFTIQVKGLEELSQNLGKSVDVLNKQVNEALDNSVTLIQKRARRNAPVFQGELKRSIRKKVRSNISRGEVEAFAKHAPYVESGTKPHFPPVAALERWGKIKLGKPGLGFVIARKIARKGTKAQPYMEPAVEESLSDVERFFKVVSDKVTAEIVK